VAQIILNRQSAKHQFMTVLVLFLASHWPGALSEARAANRVVAWGAGKVVNTSNGNDYGQSIVPAGLTNVAMVAGGWRHSMSLQADGKVAGWGDDTFGQTDFQLTNNYEAVVSGDLFTMTLLTNRTVETEGDVFYDQGDVPTNLSNVVAIACGFYHGVALKSDGTVVAWGGQGSVDYGQGTVPPGLSNVVAIAGGGWHSLALKSDGTLEAWGRNDYGQCDTDGVSNVVAIAAGAAHDLVLKSDGTVDAWGLNTYREAVVPFGLSNVIAIACGGWHNLALMSDGTVKAWGAGSGSNANVDYHQDMVPVGLSNVVQIAAGKVHSLALVGDAPPVTKALLSNFSFGTNGFSVSAPTRNGRVYRLEYVSSLSDQTWTALPLLAGSGGNLLFNDRDASSAQRFYRIREW
jgi:alpha-tubulin suppressor-like RCC1 family protein